MIYGSKQSIGALCLCAMSVGLAMKVSLRQSMDMYVMAYEWTAEYCYGQYAYFPGCNDPEEYWKTHFTIHGLWPQYSTGGYPASCTTEPFDPAVIDVVGYDRMITYWPNVEVAEGDPDYDQFWEHEWTKHGTCSGLSQEAYFNQTIALYEKLGSPSDVGNAVGGTISAEAVRNDFGGPSRCTLQCESGKYLEGVFTCWNESNGIPTTQRDCPADVLAEDSCTSSTLTIAAFSN